MSVGDYTASFLISHSYQTDPETLFSTLFGGGKFVPLIGEISIGAEMREAMREHAEYESSKGAVPPEERSRSVQSKIAKSQVVSEWFKTLVRPISYSSK